MRIEWQVRPLRWLGTAIAGRAPTDGSTAVVAVDGHSASGKTTLGRRLGATLPAAAVLHTDDLAWHQGVFDWGGLLLDDVLPVVRSGVPLDYRPPQWRARGRDGSIRLPGGLRFLVLEGVGASMAAIAGALDAICWVETDEPTRGDRTLVRLANGETTVSGERSWMAEENAYASEHQPWRAAHWLVNGGESIAYGPDEVLVAPGPAGGDR